MKLHIRIKVFMGVLSQQGLLLRFAYGIDDILTSPQADEIEIVAVRTLTQPAKGIYVAHLKSNM